MGTQQPTVAVNVRFDLDAINAIDAYAEHLRKLRGTGVSRADVMRYALVRLPIPPDAPDELKAAFSAIGARGAQQ